LARVGHLNNLLPRCLFAVTRVFGGVAVEFYWTSYNRRVHTARSDVHMPFAYIRGAGLGCVKLRAYCQNRASRDGEKNSKIAWTTMNIDCHYGVVHGRGLTCRRRPR
jgi:hypothetical protein